jgi:hypothetical protein
VTTLEATVAQALALADEAVITYVENEGVRERRGGAVWWDVTPMLSPHEHSPELLDKNRMALDYGIRRGLLAAHPFVPEMIRIVDKKGTPQ